MPPRARRPPGGRHARGGPRGAGGGRHAAPQPVTSGAAARNRQPIGAASGSSVQVARPQPVVVNPQETAGKAIKGTPRVLIAEFLICILLIAAKPFEKAGTGAKISEGTLGQFAAVMILFFILALFGGVSDRTQKAANLFGLLVTLGILFKNTESLAAVASAVNAGVKTPSTPAENNAESGPNNAGSAPTSTGA